jgi:hypothetical protein
MNITKTLKDFMAGAGRGEGCVVCERIDNGKRSFWFSRPNEVPADAKIIGTPDQVRAQIEKAN